MVSKLSRGLLGLLSALVVVAPLRADSADQADAPRISEPHREFLTRIARRSLRDAHLGRDTYDPTFVPAVLESLTAEVVVRVRDRGFLRAVGVGGPGPVTDAVRDAALAAYRTLDVDKDAPIARLTKLLVEIEVLGPTQPVKVEGDWTQWRAVDPFIEPGVHGMVLVGGRAQHRFCPTDIFTNDRVLADVLQSLAQNLHSDPSKIPGTPLYRFRTLHWYQAEAGADVVTLHRGLTIVPPDAVTARHLDESIEQLAEYMAYRQLDTGLFTYQYEPGKDQYSREDNLVRQVGATLGMALHARWSGRRASRAAADIGIRYHLQGLREIPEVENAAYIATADGHNKLGVTALLALALAEHPKPDQFASVREKLINGMLWLQRPSGMFVTAFPPAEQINAQDYFPGEALLAMAREYTYEPTARILEAFDRAISFYRGYFRRAGSPAFMPWQVQAYVILARHTKRTDYNDYVFELTDLLAEKQLTPENCAWPEMWGGIASYQPGRAGVATAAYLEGFADALAHARALGDTERAARYERVVRAAARFVMQLQVRPEEAYFIRSPQDAVGGIRTGPALNLLRIDHCQHALIGLIKAREALFPSGG